MDLDNFKEISNEQGWTKYRPNIITGTLTQLILDLVGKYAATVIYGLNEKEGTEECMLLFSSIYLEDLLQDLEHIRAEIERLGKISKTNATISIGVAVGKSIDNKPAKSRKKEYLITDPIRKFAKNALKVAKRSGGNRIIIR